MSSMRMKVSLLRDEQLDRIEETAYVLLGEVGIRLEHDEARERLHGLGCQVEGDRVFIPPEVVQWGLEHVERYSVISSADGSRQLSLGGGRICFHNGGGIPFVRDLDTGERRLASLKDVADAARLMDALPNVDVVIPLFGAQDVPAALMTPASVEAMLRNTRKPISLAAAEKPEDVRYLVEMAVACCGGAEAFRQRPTASIMVSPVSPLIFTRQVAATIMAVAKSGAALLPLPAPSLGATGPVTVAGALAQQHAELLASFLIAAATRAGTPVMYCSRINGLDPRTAVSTWGDPEIGMAAGCAAQLAHRLGLMGNSYGFCTSSSRLDPQYAYERLGNAFVPALAGMDLLSGVGILENNMSAGFDAAVIDDEIAGLLKHIIQGCEVSDETLASDVMREVIPGDGVFLGQMHTVRHIRKGAIWMPEVSERATGSPEAESVGVITRARVKAKEILGRHRVEPLPDDVSRELSEIMARARRELACDA